MVDRVASEGYEKVEDTHLSVVRCTDRLSRWRWQSERYVAIKVPVWYPSETREEAVNREVAALRCVSNANDCHPGSRHVRKMLDTFELSHPKGQHVCMVLEPLRESLHTFSQLLVDDRIPIDLLRMMVKPILQGLDFLHTECRLIHADLKPDNIMLAFTAAKEQELLHQHAENEIKRPLPQKHLEDRTIYLSHNYFGPHGIGLPVIVDLDMAVPGDVEGHYSHPIQAEGLRAPEVLIGTPWSYSVDIWSLGTMLLYVMQDQDIFRVGAGHTTDLGRMIACLGPVPMALLRRRVRSTDLFTAEGEFRELKVDKELTFESFVTRVDGKEKALFLNFVRRMLRWMPEERVSAKELLDDPWLDEER